MPENNVQQLLNFKFFQKPLAIEPHRLDSILATQIDLGLFDFEEKEPTHSFTVKDSIAILEIDGVLVSGEVGLWGRWFGLQSYEDIEEQYLDALTAPDVKGILFKINSPGGEAAGAFDLSDTIYQHRGIKPVWSIAYHEAYSAAYALASATDEIVVTRTGGVGSVGVIAVHLDRSENNKQRGLNYTLFRGGKYKAEQNELEPLSSHAKNSIQGEVDRLYNMFIETVARNRRMNVNAVQATEANVFYAGNAVETGFADREDNYKETLARFGGKLSNGQKGISMSNHKIEESKTAAQTTVMETKTETQTQTQAEAQTQTQEQTQAETNPAVSSAHEHVDSLEAISGSEKAQALEIVELCSLARKPEKAVEFLKAQLTVTEVRTRLLNEMAKESDAAGITSIHPGNGNEQSKNEVPNMGDIYRKRNVAKAV